MGGPCPPRAPDSGPVCISVPPRGSLPLPAWPLFSFSSFFCFTFKFFYSPYREPSSMPPDLLGHRSPLAPALGLMADVPQRPGPGMPGAEVPAGLPGNAESRALPPLPQSGSPGGTHLIRPNVLTQRGRVAALGGTGWEPHALGGSQGLGPRRVCSGAWRV